MANILAAVGVIATMIYLAIQIRQNNNQLRGTATIAVWMKRYIAAKKSTGWHYTALREDANGGSSMR